MNKKFQSESDSRALGEGLTLMRTCPVCRRDFAAEALRVIEERDAMHVVHMTCGNCATALLAMILSSDLGTSSIGVMTDLSADDALRLFDREIFSQDDVLAFYSFVERYGVSRELSGKS